MECNNFSRPSHVDHWHMAVTFKEEHREAEKKETTEEDVTFSAPIPLFKLERGKCKHSYGIECAERAGVPLGQLLRAKEVLKSLDKSELPLVHEDTLTSSSVVTTLISTSWRDATEDYIESFLTSLEEEANMTTTSSA